MKYPLPWAPQDAASWGKQGALLEPLGSMTFSNYTIYFRLNRTGPNKGTLFATIKPNIAFVNPVPHHYKVNIENSNLANNIGSKCAAESYYFMCRALPTNKAFAFDPTSIAGNLIKDLYLFTLK